LGVTASATLVCLLAFLAGTAEGASKAKPVAFRVTLTATVTKDWNTVTETTVDGCPNSRHSVGRRTVKLRSARPTTVFVTFARGRISYSPAVVRSVRIDLVQTGNETLKVTSPCEARTTHALCVPKRRAISATRFGFFRSARNEISFRSAWLPELSSACPRESSRVRALRSGLRAAQGELSEAALANPRTPNQTAFGGVEVTTDLDGEETGTVVEGVRWELTFTRKR
jgi:hypothetical protein